MKISPELDSLPPQLVEALTAQGFETLTTVQQAVLDPGTHDRDLRISSETGSGKTVAIGLVLGRELAGLGDRRARSGPVALLLTPTRELAGQVCRELGWLLEPLGLKLAAVTGGTAFGPEVRALKGRPDVLVATPGRLRDHLERGTLDASSVQSVVLDEADQMLDFGFREELDAILGHLPAERRAHLVSATFAKEVLRLAERYQNAPVLVRGTEPGKANDCIEHTLHVVPPSHREAALVNVLLCAPTERSLVFARTRADVANVAERLQQAGFAAADMSGDLNQAERTRRLAAFRSGAVPILVATDVAARGLDVPDVSRVVHLHPVNDADTYTHRSGRTGRAGRSGQSIVLSTPREQHALRRLFRSLGVTAREEPVPGREHVQRAAEARLRSRFEEARDVPEELRATARRLLEDRDAESVVAELLAQSGFEGPCATQDIPAARELRRAGARAPGQKADRGEGRRAAGGRNGAGRPALGPVKVVQVNWGARQGADARRLVAMVCRRSGLTGAQIGAIDVGPKSSHLEVPRDEAARVVTSLSQPDERNPKMRARIASGPLQRGPGRAPPSFAGRGDRGGPRSSSRNA